MRRSALVSTLSLLLPGTSADADNVLRVFLRAARARGTARHAWQQHIDDLYGALDGQRALALDRTASRYSSHDARTLIQTLQTYFVLVADLIAVARLRRGDPLSRLPAGRLRAALQSLAAGRQWKSLGIDAPLPSVPFDWYVSHIKARELEAFRGVMRAAEAIAAEERASLDPMQELYGRLMPRNLLHATGEFYTPPWLAQLVLEDSRWTPEQTLLDPFAGSGIFLLTALQHAVALGSRPLTVLERLGAIDRNPVACVAARTNLILQLADTLGDEQVNLPILCSDSLQDDHSPLPSRADVLVTNPPWVGWEYLPRAYRARLNPEWKRYDLFTAKGREAAFLKEDLSTLALVSAWDRFLRPGGRSAVVLRPAAMQSHLAARGLRRLSLREEGEALALERIRLFPGLRVFGTAQAPAATWSLLKTGDRPTRFPVPVIEWQGPTGRQPTAASTLATVRQQVTERHLTAARSDPDDTGSSWTIGDSRTLQAAAALAGANPYQVRTGVFTGGGNGVYYVERLGDGRKTGMGRYRNCPDGARRAAPGMQCELEDALVYEVVRGRDLGLWQASTGPRLLCPHTPETRMRAISPEPFAQEYPHAFRYLNTMRPVLDARKGFSGWEAAQRQQAFYALQRVGAYSFQPYKVAWRYIARDFIVAVIGPASDGRARLCNDKVMFVGCDGPMEAYFLAGILTSEPIRWSVTATMTGTQISTSAIRHLGLPPFEADDCRHVQVAESCRRGHASVAEGDFAAAQAALDEINGIIGDLFRLSARQRRAFPSAPRFPIPLH